MVDETGTFDEQKVKSRLKQLADNPKELNDLSIRIVNLSKSLKASKHELEATRADLEKAAMS